MSVMNTTGWATPYKINRTLNDDDRRDQLNLAHKTVEIPDSNWSSIRINDVFMEVVDKAYPFRGIWAFFGVPLFFLCLFASTAFPLGIATNFNDFIEKGNSVFLIVIAFAFFLIAFGGMTILLAYLLRKEVFAYSHYPVRLNRQNGMVYVFRNNGANGVLAAPWKDIFWQKYRCGKPSSTDGGEWEIRGLVLDAAGTTVVDAFGLGPCDDFDTVDRQWAHFRGYMVNGTAQPDRLLPIADRKEPFLFGLRCAAEHAALHPLVMVLGIPIWGVMAFARSVTMLTCRAPRWPAYVHAACVVPEGTEPRPQDIVSHVLGETTWSRIVVVLGSLAGAACGSYFLYWVFTGSGFVRIVKEFFVGRAV